jgi:hypothetical protein
MTFNVRSLLLAFLAFLGLSSPSLCQELETRVVENKMPVCAYYKHIVSQDEGFSCRLVVLLLQDSTGVYVEFGEYECAIDPDAQLTPSRLANEVAWRYTCDPEFANEFEGVGMISFTGNGTFHMEGSCQGETGTFHFDLSGNRLQLDGLHIGLGHKVSLLRIKQWDRPVKARRKITLAGDPCSRGIWAY